MHDEDESPRSSEKRITRMLSTVDKGASDAKGILSRLLRLIMINYDVGPATYERFLASYLKRHGLNSSERGNFNKALLRDSMTINNFIKSLDFLGVRKIKITVELTRVREKHATVHSLEVDNIATLIKKRRTEDSDYH